MRERADKVKQGKMQKVRKAKGYTKNIYLQKDDQKHLADNSGKPVNRKYFSYHSAISTSMTCTS
jgi:flavorubredoxin